MKKCFARGVWGRLAELGTGQVGPVVKYDTGNSFNYMYCADKQYNIHVKRINISFQAINYVLLVLNKRKPNFF